MTQAEINDIFQTVFDALCERSDQLKLSAPRDLRFQGEIDMFIRLKNYFNVTVELKPPKSP